MYLVFTDESGTNKDSQVVLYGGLCINENNLIKSEIVVLDIVKDFFGIDNLLEYEIHFVDVFNYVFYERLPSKPKKRKKFQENIVPYIQSHKITKEKLCEFVSELFQFLNKVNAFFLVSFVQKTQNKSMGYVFKVFLNLLDHFLNEKNENGILIADGIYTYKNSNLKNVYAKDFVFDENLEKQKELLFKRILFESQSWKYNGLDIKDHFPLKYKFESKVYNIHSNILFISSQESILIQISDILLYVIKKFFDFHINDTLKEFFNKDLLNTLEFVMDLGNLRIATLTQNYDIALFYDINSFRSFLMDDMRQSG